MPEPTRGSNLDDFVSRSNTLEAEVWWALKVVHSHYSFKSSENMPFLFRKMFPDSHIAKKFTCGETKCRYLCCFGIAPYFQSLMLDKVKKEANYVLLFDESLNHKTQNKQLDMHVRVWQGDNVKTRYFTSKFIGHATATDLLNHFHESIRDLALPRLMQVSMDGPNVNWSFYNQLDVEIKRDFNSTLLNIGSCGLHTLHNSFKAGSVASGWGIDQLLSSLFYLFKDSPARREDYAELVGSALPLKFCKHRWLENLPVVARIEQIWPQILIYVEAVAKKNIKDPKTKSFEVVKDSCEDKLILAKLACFKSVASQIHPFLTLYQTDKPMIPFLCTDLEKILRDILERFMKNDILKNITQQSLIKMDITEKKNHLCSKQIKVGFQAETILNNLKIKKKISELEVLEFTMQCKDFFLHVAKKLLEKSPMKYSLARNIACLDPRNLAKGKQHCQQKFKHTLRLLVGANRLDEAKCDEVIRQFDHFIDEVVSCRMSDFAHFDPVSQRVDVLFYDSMSHNKQYSDLWSIIKPLLLLSHGQASVERGFSINRQIEVENLKGESYIALRSISDHIQHVGGMVNVQLDKHLIQSAAGARQKYQAYLNKQAEDKRKGQENGKRKLIDEEIFQLKQKRKCLLEDIKEMNKSADDFSDKAEQKRNFSYIAKANSLRHSAKDKELVLIDLDKTIQETLDRLKNS